MEKIVTIRKYVFSQHLKIGKDIKIPVLTIRISFITFIKIGNYENTNFYQIDDRAAESAASCSVPPRSSSSTLPRPTTGRPSSASSATNCFSRSTTFLHTLNVFTMKWEKAFRVSSVTRCSRQSRLWTDTWHSSTRTRFSFALCASVDSRKSRA